MLTMAVHSGSPASMTDSAPLDPAFVALLADPRSALRPPAPGTSIADYRARLDRPMAAIAGPVLDAVDEATTAEGIRVRIYRPSAAAGSAILFFHGGGFVTGSLATHDAMCRTLARASGAMVVAVAYRLVPDVRFPGPLQDGLSALAWVMRTLSPHRVAIVGDSAGGHLATTVAIHAVRTGVAISGLGLLYPVVGPECDTASWHRLGTGHMLTRDWMRWAWEAYLAGEDAAQADVDLLRADLRGLPPTHIVTAGFDPLCDEGEALGAAIIAAGGAATVTRYPGMIHGFASLPMLTPLADEAIARVAVNIGVD